MPDVRNISTVEPLIDILVGVCSDALILAFVAYQ